VCVCVCVCVCVLQSVCSHPISFGAATGAVPGRIGKGWFDGDVLHQSTILNSKLIGLCPAQVVGHWETTLKGLDLELKGDVMGQLVEAFILPESADPTPQELGTLVRTPLLA